MNIVKCIFRAADDTCEWGTLLIDRLDGDVLVRGDRPDRLVPVGSTVAQGWGDDVDGDVQVYKDPTCSWSALIRQSEVDRIIKSQEK